MGKKDSAAVVAPEVVSEADLEEIARKEKEMKKMEAEAKAAAEIALRKNRGREGIFLAKARKIFERDGKVVFQSRFPSVKIWKPCPRKIVVDGQVVDDPGRRLIFEDHFLTVEEWEIIEHIVRLHVVAQGDVVIVDKDDLSNLLPKAGPKPEPKKPEGSPGLADFMKNRSGMDGWGAEA